MASQVPSNVSIKPIVLNVGFYDPFSTFKGGFKSEFEAHCTIPSLHWKSTQDTIKIIKNVQLNFIEEIPNNSGSSNPYLKFIFISCQSIDDYRSKVRPLIRQWLNNVKCIEPKIVYYIVLFENTELKTAADKFLKTNILNKLKTDFDDTAGFSIDNIFKIKSMYYSQDDRSLVWSNITNSIKLGLVSSINNKLQYYQVKNPNLSKTAAVFQDIGQIEDSLACFSRLFQSTGNVRESDVGFTSFSIESYSLLFHSSEKDYELPAKPSNFQLKSYYYKKESNILLDSNVSNSICFRNIIRLARLLIIFLDSIEPCYKRYELSIILIEDYLNDTRLQDLLKIETNATSELLAVLGDLKLKKRNELISLGLIKGYQLKGSMTNIQLNEPITNDDNYEIRDPNIIEILESNKTFIDKIVVLTQDLIKCYSSSQLKKNSVKALSTEIALIIYYSAEDYDSPLEMLNKSIEFYNKSGWKYIELCLLEAYIENLEKILSIRGDEIVPTLLSSYLELISQNKSSFKIDKFLSLVSKITEEEILEKDNLFSVKIKSPIYCENADIYKLQIEMKINIRCPVDNIVLYLQNPETQETVQFSANDFELSNKTNFIELKCSNIIFGTFTVTHVVLNISKVKIVARLNFTVDIFQIKSFYDFKSDKVIDNTLVDIIVTPKRALHYDVLLFEVEVGSQNFDRCMFDFFKTEADRLVSKSEFTLKLDNQDIEFKVYNNDEKIVFEAHNIFKSHSKISLYIPYFFPPDVSNTILNLKFGFKFGNGDYQFSQKFDKQLDSILPLAVSVDEIFRASKLFSNFTINSVHNDNPVRIQKAHLASNSSSIKTWEQPEDIIAFIDQGSRFFYKIKDLNDTEVHLCIHYNDIRSEVISKLKKSFFNVLIQKHKNLIKYVSISDLVWNRIKIKLNFYALTGKIHPIDFEIEEFTSFFKVIGKDDLLPFVECINEFVKRLPVLGHISYQEKDLLEEVCNQLLIVVTLPVINIINIVEYKFEKKLQYLVCEPIKTKVLFDLFVFNLKIEKNKKVRFEGEELKPDFVSLRLEFFDYEQNWLISGLKDFEIEIDLNEAQNNNKGSHQEFELMLIPLRAGKLELPKIDIKNSTDVNLSMEIDFKNSSESLLVVSELNKVIHSF